MNMATRFSKAALATRLFGIIHNLEMMHNFNRSNGSAQVEGMGEEINRDYAALATALETADYFELEEPAPPSSWCPYNKHQNPIVGKPRKKV